MNSHTLTDEQRTDEQSLSHFQDILALASQIIATVNTTANSNSDHAAMNPSDLGVLSNLTNQLVQQSQVSHQQVVNQAYEQREHQQSSMFEPTRTPAPMGIDHITGNYVRPNEIVSPRPAYITLNLFEWREDAPARATVKCCVRDVIH